MIAWLSYISAFLIRAKVDCSSIRTDSSLRPSCELSLCNMSDKPVKEKKNARVIKDRVGNESEFIM